MSLGFENESDKSSERNFFEFAADVDFWHDFDHADKMDYPSFFNVIATSLPQTKEYKQVFTTFSKEAQGQTPWAFFSKKAEIRTILPDTEAFLGRMNANEDAIVDNIWEKLDTGSVSMDECKKKLREAFHNIAIPSSGETLPAYQDKVKIKIAAPRPADASSKGVLNSREYDITAYPVQIQGKTVSSIVSLLETADTGVRNFIILIDVTYLSIKRIRKVFLDKIGSKYRKEEKYNIFIVSSVENDSDPAGKIRETEYTQLKPDRDDLGNINQTFELYNNIDVYFLQEEDKQHISTYYPYDKSLGSKSLLYSRPELKTTRTPDGLIRAEVSLPNNGPTVVHRDLGSVSEIASAAKAMARKYMDYTLDGSLTQENKKQEISHYYLLKRAGDWCQALCLLDRDRKYKVSIEKGGKWTDSTYGTKSLNELCKALETNGGTEIALMTHDRVLLTYALQLGLNVFFTVKLQDLKEKKKAGSPEVGSPKEKKGSTMVLIYFKNVLSKDPKFLYSIIWNQINDLLALKGEPQKPKPSTPITMANLIIAAASISLPEPLRTEGAAAKIIKLIETNRSNFTGDNLEIYLKTLRKVLFVGSRLDPTPPVRPDSGIIRAATEPTQVGDYIYKCIKYIKILNENKNLSASLDNIDGVSIANFEKEAKTIVDMVASIRTQTNYKRDLENNSASSATWEKFLNGTLKYIMSDYKTCFSNGIKLGSVLPPSPPDVTGRSRQNGPAAFYAELTKLIPVGGSQRGGGSDDDYLEGKLAESKIYTTPLNITIGDLSNKYLIDNINKAFFSSPNKPLALKVAEIAFDIKIYQLREPNLTDYCTDIVLRFMGLTAKPESHPEIENTVYDLMDAKDQEESIFIKKTYTERGRKILDIANQYNTVVDDYMIDYNNADMFRYFYNKRPSFTNSTNLGRLYYRFIVYYSDRLSASIYNFSNINKDLLLYKSDIHFIEYELLNLRMALESGPSEANLMNIMKVFYTKKIDDEQKRQLSQKQRMKIGLADLLEHLQRDNKRYLLATILQYYSTIGVVDMNSQLLEGLLYNLCSSQQDARDTYTLANKSLIPDDYKDSLIDAANVVLIAGNALHNGLVDIVSTVATGTSNLNIQQSRLKEKAAIYYARAIRLVMNKLPSQSQVQKLLEWGYRYISVFIEPSDLEVEDIKNLAIVRMYYETLKTTSTPDPSSVAMQVATNDVVSKADSTISAHAYVELIANYINLYMMVDPTGAQSNKFYLAIDGARVFYDKTINMEDLVDLINNYLEDMDVPIRAGGKPSTA